jgi:extradiol dioxygenase family protein
MTSIHHVALHVNDVASAVSWYRGAFNCSVSYQDATWAMLEFENVSLALVSHQQHPPHIAVTVQRADRFGQRDPRRDATRSI